MLSPVAPLCVAAARVLLEEQGSDVPVDVALTRACEALSGRLRPWIGGDGFARVLHRARAMTAEAHPKLTEGTLASADPAEARAAAEALLGGIVDQLARLVGEAVALRVVLPENPAAWGAPPADGDDS